LDIKLISPKREDRRPETFRRDEWFAKVFWKRLKSKLFESWVWRIFNKEGKVV